eukprot:552160_1
METDKQELLPHESDTKQAKIGSSYLSYCCILCDYYGLWIIIGFYTGFHWIVLASLETNYWDRLRLECILQTIIYWLFAILFWVFRQTMLPWVVSCDNGKVMSRDCLFHEQSTKYTVFYVIHIYLMIWSFAAWFFDAIFVIIFLKQIHQNVSKSTKLLVLRFIIITIITSVIIIIWSQINWSA